MPVSDRIEYHQPVQVYNCLEGHCPSELQHVFEHSHNVINQNTRSAYNDKLFIPVGIIKGFDTSVPKHGMLSIHTM